jgi:hypothetical protein
MSVVCVQCESGVTIARSTMAAPPADATCWSHHLAALLADSSDDARFVLVVARHEAALFERVSDQLLDEARVSVVLDRRRGARGRTGGALARPLWERRRFHQLAEDPRSPITIVAVGASPRAVRFSSVPTSGATDAPRTVNRRLSRWLAAARVLYLTKKARLTARLRHRSPSR